MKNHALIPYIYLLLALVLNSCGKSGMRPVDGSDTAAVRQDCNAVYYWKTRFALSGADTAFLRQHDVGRVYLRLFDVDVQTDPLQGGDPVIPVGTAVFDGTMPDSLDVVPVVFITVRAMEKMMDLSAEDYYAGRIVTRILNMADYHGLGPLREVQLDCDWTESTQQAFYRLCSEARRLLDEREVMLSATIRLHQLRQDPPPVDRGVLMLYNTGAVTLPGTGNSIIDVDDVRRYLGGNPVRYALPLDFAYPTYGWGVWFRGREFMGLLHHTDYGDATRYVPDGDGMLRVRCEHVLEGHLLRVGDRIRPESSPFASVLSVKRMVDDAFPDQPHSNILYHLDSTNLSKYTPDEIRSLYRR